jgi:N-ethylmaleimide reductase
MVRGARPVFGRTGCGLEKNHERSSRQTGLHVLPTLAHGARASHVDTTNGITPVSSSVNPDYWQDPTILESTPQGWQQPSPHRALEIREIPEIVEDYRKASDRAKAAGFDGVELSAGNGYLPDQFLQDGINKRTDMYGGSIENRSRFLLQVIDAMVSVWGGNRVGVRIAPSGTWNGVSDSDPIALFDYVAQQLNRFVLAYLHIIEPAINARFADLGREFAFAIFREFATTL